MPSRPASSHWFAFVLIGLIVLGLGTMVYVMRNPTAFRASAPPTQSSRSAGIIISTGDFVTLPAGSSATIYVAGIDRDRTTNRTINGVVQTEDVMTDAALPNGASLNRCIYTGYFGATPIQVSMYCLTYNPSLTDLGNHPIVLRAKEFGTGVPSDSPLTLTLIVQGVVPTPDMATTLTSITPITTPLNLPFVTSFTVRNSGTATGTNVQLSVNLPTGFGYYPSLSSTYCTHDTGPVVCNLPNFGPNAAASFDIAMTPLNQSVCSTTVQITGSTSVAAPEVNTTNNVSAPRVVTVSCPPPDSSSSSSSADAGPNLVVNATASPTAALGGNVRTVYNISNTGTANAVNVRLRTAVPTVPGMTFNPIGSDPSCAISGTDIVCGPVPLLAPNAGYFSMIVNYKVSFAATCPSTFLRNATVTSENPALALAPNLSTSVTCTPTNPYCCFSGVCAEQAGCPMNQTQCLASCGVSSSSSSVSSSSSSVTAAFCGDGIVNGTEECDDGMQCASFGTSCTSNANCQSGQTCQTWDGDGCFANCSLMFPPDSIFP